MEPGKMANTIPIKTPILPSVILIGLFNMDTHICLINSNYK